MISENEINLTDGEFNFPSDLNITKNKATIYKNNLTIQKEGQPITSAIQYGGCVPNLYSCASNLLYQVSKGCASYPHLRIASAVSGNLTALLPKHVQLPFDFHL